MCEHKKNSPSVTSATYCTLDIQSPKSHSIRRSRPRLSKTSYNVFIAYCLIWMFFDQASYNGVKCRNQSPTLLNGTIHTYAYNTSAAFCATRQSSKCYCATGDAIVQQDAVSNSESGRRPCANTAKETHTCTHTRAQAWPWSTSRWTSWRRSRCRSPWSSRPAAASSLSYTAGCSGYTRRTSGPNAWWSPAWIGACTLKNKKKNRRGERKKNRAWAKQKSLWDLQTAGRWEGEAGTLAAEGSLDAWELDRLVQRLLLLAELAESHDAVELLVVLAASLAAELVDFVLDRQETP